jgi:hypothetical protein
MTALLNKMSQPGNGRADGAWDMTGPPSPAKLRPGAEGHLAPEADHSGKAGAAQGRLAAPPRPEAKKTINPSVLLHLKCTSYSTQIS